MQQETRKKNMSTNQIGMALYSPHTNNTGLKSSMTAGRPVEMQSTHATTFMQSPTTTFKASNTFGSAVKNIQQKAAFKKQDSSIFGSSGFNPNKSYMSNATRQPRKQNTKTTAYLARFDAARDINAFWKNVTDISLNQNKIEHLDHRIRNERNMENPEPQATVAQRGSEPVYQPEARRGGNGGVYNMHQNTSKRRVDGSVLPEHNHTGQSMSYVMNPEERDTRRCRSVQVAEQRFTKSSQQIGTQPSMFGSKE